jgi:hypothetical protein
LCAGRCLAQSAGQSAAVSGAEETLAGVGKFGQVRELWEDREPRQTPPASDVTGDSERHRHDQGGRDRDESVRMPENRERQQHDHHDGGRGASCAPVAQEIQAALDCRTLGRWLWRKTHHSDRRASMRHGETKRMRAPRREHRQECPG